MATVLLLSLFAAGRFKAQDGRAFVVAIALWAVIRFGVAFVWRDPTILGPLRAGQLIALGMAVVSLLLLPSLRGAPSVVVKRAVEDADP